MSTETSEDLATLSMSMRCRRCGEEGRHDFKADDELLKMLNFEDTIGAKQAWAAVREIAQFHREHEAKCAGAVK